MDAENVDTWKDDLKFNKQSKRLIITKTHVTLCMNILKYTRYYRSAELYFLISLCEWSLI